MNSTNPDPIDYLPLTPAVFHILLALADADLHGYAIMKEVEARTKGQLQLKPGTLYQAIRRLLDTGIILELDKSELDSDIDERRRTYRLSPFGKQVVVAEARRLEEMVHQAHDKKILGEGKIGFSTI